MAVPALQARDLSLIPGCEPGSDWDHWLSELQHALNLDEWLLSLSDSIQEDDWIIRRNEWGQWVAGRFIGEIAYKGRRLEIRPRFEGDFIEWLEAALNVAVIAESASHEYDGSFMNWLMATIWTRTLDSATRHGLPNLKRDQNHEGDFVRGRLDVRRTMRLKARGSLKVASTMRVRDLDNPISRTLVAAVKTLRSAIGGSFWQPQQSSDAIAQMRAAVGSNPSLPSRSELEGIRYSPITRRFRSVTELSWRIARREGLNNDPESGDADGFLLDAAELWELFLVQCLKEALPQCRVEHGTTSDDRTYLLGSETIDRSLGQLKPDCLVFTRDGDNLIAIIDAKYKHLRNTETRPTGVDRGDLYQLTSYLSRFDPYGKAVGMLLYPFDPELEVTSTAELGNPWCSEAGSQVRFERIPTGLAQAVSAIGALQIHS